MEDFDLINDSYGDENLVIRQEGIKQMILHKQIIRIQNQDNFLITNQIIGYIN